MQVCYNKDLFDYQLALDKADRTWVDAFQRYTGKANFTDPAWTYGATTFADWVRKGYIATSSVGTKAEDAGVAFIQGKVPMMLSGSWWFGRIAKEAGFTWDTFVWPEAKQTLGSGGNIWVVPKGSKHKDLAYDFIGITRQKAIQKALGNAGGIPVASDAAAITNPQAKKLIENFTTLAAENRLAYYPDGPVPGFYDVWVSPDRNRGHPIGRACEIMVIVRPRSRPAQVIGLDFRRHRLAMAPDDGSRTPQRRGGRGVRLARG